MHKFIHLHSTHNKMVGEWSRKREQRKKERRFRHISRIQRKISRRRPYERNRLWQKILGRTVTNESQETNHRSQIMNARDQNPYREQGKPYLAVGIYRKEQCGGNLGSSRRERKKEEQMDIVNERNSSRACVHQVA